MTSTVDFVNRNFARYTQSLLEFNSEQLLRVMTPALLGLPILENPKANIRGSGRSWEDLEKAGLITLRDKCVELPFIFVQIYAQHLRTQGVKLTGLIDILNELRGGSSWRQNEKCHLAVAILQILHWYYNHPNRNSFRLEEVFWGVKGTAASAELDIPKAIKFTDILDTWPICLESMFNPEEHLREGAYLGCGQDMFADSWIVFNRARDDGKVVLAVESKQRTKPEPLTAKYFNDHKKKVCVDVSPLHFLYTSTYIMSCTVSTADSCEFR